MEEYDSQDICPGRGEEDQRMRRDQLQGTWFLSHSEDVLYNCYSALATPVGPVQCWSVSGAHAGLLGEDCLVESLQMYITKLEQIILIFSSKISLYSGQLECQ